MLQSLELLEQNTVSQIRAMKGLVLAAVQEEATQAPTRTQSAFAERDFEDRLGSWLADNGGMEFGELDGVERLSESKATDS